MIKRLYSQTLFLISLVCYIIIFIHLSNPVTNSLRFSFGLTLAIINAVATTVEILNSCLFIQAGTIEDIYFRQRSLLIIGFTIFFTIATLVVNDLWYIGAVLLQLSVTFHRSVTSAEVLSTLLDIVLLIIWVVFLVELYSK